jgi:hypothetical protein
MSSNVNDESTFVFVCHGTREIKKSESTRYKLQIDNMYYITYSQYGMEIQKDMGCIINLMIEERNEELKKIILMDNHTDKPFKVMKEYVVILMRLLIDNLKNNIDGLKDYITKKK